MTGSRRLIGRQVELETFDAALAATVGSHGGLLLVAGEAGIGKSRLLEAFAVRADAAGARVAFGRAWDFGGAPALWPWIQVLRALSADPSLLVPGPVDGETRFARFEAITAFLVAAAQAQPLVILLDDLHACDLASIAMLRFVVSARPAQRVLCVGAYRDVGAGASEDVDRALAQLARDASQVQLRGLDRAELAALVADLGDGTPPDRLVGAVAAATGGNPLFAGELVRVGVSAAELERAGSGHLPLPRTVRDALSDHLASLSPVAQRLVAVAAVIGRPATVYFLQHVGELSPAATREAIVELRAARLLIVDPGDSTRVMLGHALVREAAMGRLSADERHALHRRAGEALEALYAQALDAHLAELARHFVVVAERGDADKAVRYSVAAGDASLRLAAHEDAVEHYLRARALVEARGGAGSEAHDELLLKIGDALIGAGRSGEAARLFAQLGERARAAGRAAVLGRAALGFARTGEYLEHVPDKRRWLEDAADLLPQDDPLRVRVMSRLAVELHLDATARQRRDALADGAIALARSRGEPQLIAFALDAALQSRYGVDSVDERLRVGDELVAIGEASDDDTIRGDGLRWRLTARVERGEIARAVADSDRALALAERRRAPGPLVNALSRAATLAVATGRLADGETLAWRAWDVESRASNAAMAGLLYNAMLAVPRAACGRRRELEEALPDFLATAERLARPFLLAWAAWMAAALDDRARAQLLLARLAAPGLAAAPDDFARLGLWALAADVALATDDRDTAVEAGQLLSRYSGRIVTVGTAAILGPTELYLAKVAARFGTSSEARRQADAAVAAAEASGLELWLARALLLEPETRGRARALCDELGLHAWIEAAPPTATTTAARVRAGRFVRDGAMWTVALDGKAAQAKDARGMHHVARLLAEPGRELHALELDGREPLPASDAGPLLDAEAKASYRRRLAALRELVADAEERGDADGAEEAKSEIEALSHELARAVGLGGRDRKAGAAAERARMRVTTAIRRALDAVARVHPDVAAHLRRALRTGTFLVYDPDPANRVDWTL